MANKDKLTPAEAATSPVEVKEFELTQAVPGLNEQVLVQPEPVTAEPSVRTGVDIRNGKPVMKAAPVKKQAAVKWNTGDRAPYTAHTAGTGSLNGRDFNFKAGELINLNADEAKLFAAYVTKVAK